MARVKRPVLDRDGPIRSWSSTLNPAEPSDRKDQSRSDQAPRVDDQDPIVRGVVVGGRVVDEWIRQARQTARLLGGTAPAGSWPDATGLMFKATSDLVAAWLSMLGSVPRNGFGGLGGSQPGPTFTESDRPTRHPPEAAPTYEPKRPGASETHSRSQSLAGRLRIEVASRRPVEVIVDVHKRGVTQFRVFDLRAEQGEAPRIQGVGLEPWDGDGLKLHLVVPDDQPAGAYHAVILDATADTAVGTVTLRIPD